MMRMLRNIIKLLPESYSKRYGSAVAALDAKRNPIEKQQPLINCRRKQFNIWNPLKEETKFGTIPLASSGWLSNKSKGDYFIINATISEEQIKSENQDLREFLQTSNFTHFNEQLIQNVLNQLDINELTNIQVNAIPSVYNNNHVLIAAETGCGKTLAYLLPIVQKIIEYKQNPTNKERKLNSPLALIITPGRELADQIGNVAKLLGQNLNINVKTILGGNTKRLMMNPEFDDVDILVATMGALSKLVTTGIYRVGEVRHVILDEADTLLDDSFTGKLTHFLKRFPFHKLIIQSDVSEAVQLILASATMPTNTNEVLRRIINVETLQEIVSPHLHRLMPHIEQKFQRLSKADRPAALISLVKNEMDRKRPIIIFCNKSATCDFVSIFLNNNGINALSLNGDMAMKFRVGRFEQFQRGDCNVLSATDIGSRGLDTIRARHILNYDFPLHVSDYIHRCGRIGRMGNLQKSLVTNFISSRREIDIVQKIEHAARTGGILPDVNANIRNIINKRIEADMMATGIPLPNSVEF